jgi:excisionase family DNA binding protein
MADSASSRSDADTDARAPWDLHVGDCLSGLSQLGVSNATVYGLCERGELPYVWVVTSMRIRPDDLEEFIASRVTIAEEPRPHRRKTPSE